LFYGIICHSRIDPGRDKPGIVPGYLHSRDIVGTFPYSKHNFQNPRPELNENPKEHREVHPIHSVSDEEQKALSECR
jgi:hypothetical protein